MQMSSILWHIRCFWLSNDQNLTPPCVKMLVFYCYYRTDLVALVCWYVKERDTENDKTWKHVEVEECIFSISTIEQFNIAARILQKTMANKTASLLGSLTYLCVCQLLSHISVQILALVWQVTCPIPSLVLVIPHLCRTIHLHYYHHYYHCLGLLTTLDLDVDLYPNLNQKLHCLSEVPIQNQSCVYECCCHCYFVGSKTFKNP